MPASWVAASTRARLLGDRRIGRERAAALANSGGLGPALQMLQASPYGANVDSGMPLEAAQRQVAATILWNFRVLAGWLPPGGSAILLPLVAWFEIANIEERLAYLSGGGHIAPYQLGNMGSAWRAVSRATTTQAVREGLTRSRWGDPGTSDPSGMVLALRFKWAGWVAGSVPGADAWAATAVALLGARIRFASTASPEGLPQIPGTAYGLPPGWQHAASLPQLRAFMSPRLAWVLDGVEEPSDLWAAEARWWSRAETDAAQMVLRSRYGPSAVVGIAMLLGHDAWLTRAALGAAARGLQAKGVFDAVA
jgi:hypothetical protein